jgi:hypothetical protein
LVDKASSPPVHCVELGSGLGDFLSHLGQHFSPEELRRTAVDLIDWPRVLGQGEGEFFDLLRDQVRRARINDKLRPDAPPPHLSVADATTVAPTSSERWPIGTTSCAVVA